MIKEACLSDFDAMSDLENQVFHIHLNARPDMIKPKLPFNKDYFETCLSDEDIKIFVFEENGEILGYCITKKSGYNDHHLYRDMTILDINDMCVDEKARGKGIGRQLFDRAKDHAKEIGAVKIELSVWSFNINARQFYERLGMKERTIRMEIMIE